MTVCWQKLIFLSFSILKLLKDATLDFAEGHDSQNISTNTQPLTHTHIHTRVPPDENAHFFAVDHKALGSSCQYGLI